jgi:hypothetical protein
MLKILLSIFTMTTISATIAAAAIQLNTRNICAVIIESLRRRVSPGRSYTSRLSFLAQFHRTHPWTRRRCDDHLLNAGATAR